jgi:PBP1b-binding outer membrane lipoprotein LpoB
MLKIRIFMPLILATVLLLAGCGNKDEGTTQQVSSTQEQDYIKRIENDPNMPPQAKAAAIKNMKDQQANARLAAEGRKQ